MEIIRIIAAVLSYCSLSIIAYGALLALIKFVKVEFSRFTHKFMISALSDIRLDFGYYLLLGLEFLIASDIIRTILDPALEGLAALGGIVVIRTVLTYFLNKEVKEVNKLNRKTNVSGKT